MSPPAATDSGPLPPRVMALHEAYADPGTSQDELLDALLQVRVSDVDPAAFPAQASLPATCKLSDDANGSPGGFVHFEDTSFHQGQRLQIRTQGLWLTGVRFAGGRRWGGGSGSFSILTAPMPIDGPVAARAHLLNEVRNLEVMASSAARPKLTGSGHPELVPKPRRILIEAAELHLLRSLGRQPSVIRAAQRALRSEEHKEVVSNQLRLLPLGRTELLLAMTAAGIAPPARVWGAQLVRELAKEYPRDSGVFSHSLCSNPQWDGSSVGYALDAPRDLSKLAAILPSHARSYWMPGESVPLRQWPLVQVALLSSARALQYAFAVGFRVEGRTIVFGVDNKSGVRIDTVPVVGDTGSPATSIQNGPPIRYGVRPRA